MQCEEYIKEIMKKQGALDGTTAGSIREAFARIVTTPYLTGDNFDTHHPKKHEQTKKLEKKAVEIPEFTPEFLRKTLEGAGVSVDTAQVDAIFARYGQKDLQAAFEKSIKASEKAWTKALDELEMKKQGKRSLGPELDYAEIETFLELYRLEELLEDLYEYDEEDIIAAFEAAVEAANETFREVLQEELEEYEEEEEPDKKVKKSTVMVEEHKDI